MLSREDLQGLTSRKALLQIAEKREVSTRKHVFRVRYEEQMRHLQAQLVELQRHIIDKKLRVAVIFEGRDAAGKGGAIRRFMEHLNPRAARVVALNKPTEVERGQWYFRRYVKELPNAGEIVFFDRSWYNRAVVEPVMGFCDDHQYRQFMGQVPEFEHMMHEDGLHIVKFWFSISRKEQKKRFDSRLQDPLKRWKYSPVDERGQELWEDYTRFKEQMFSLTHTSFSPWIIVRGNNKKKARLESIRYVLSRFDYPGKDAAETTVLPDPNLVRRYHRKVKQIDV